MAKYNPLDTTDKDYRKTVFDLLQKKPPIQQVNKMAGNAKFYGGSDGIYWKPMGKCKNFQAKNPNLST